MESAAYYGSYYSLHCMLAVLFFTIAFRALPHIEK